MDTLAIDNNESINRLSQRLGPVEDLSGKTITFAFDGKDENGDGIEIDLVLERNYGNPAEGASATETIKIDTFTLRSSLTQYVKTFDVPSLNGKTLKGDTSLTLRFELPLQKAVKISLTSVIARLGNIESPEFLNLPVALLNAQIIGQGIDLQQRSSADNFATLSYYSGGFFFQAKSGTYEMMDIDAAKTKQNVIILDKNNRLAFPARGANKYGIPYINLFHKLGTKWGSEGDLQVINDQNKITFTSLAEDTPKGGDASYGVGDLTSWTLKKVQKANKYGVKATKKSSVVLSIESTEVNTKQLAFSSPIRDSNSTYSYYVYNSNGNYNGASGRPSKYMLSTFDKKYQNIFARKISGGPVPDQLIPLGSGICSVTDTQDASSTLPWIVDIEFKSSALNDYLSSVVNRSGPSGYGLGDVRMSYNSNTLSWGISGYCLGGMNFSGDTGRSFGITGSDKFLIAFDIDGKASTSGVSEDVLIKVQAKSTDTLDTLLSNTVKAVNNPFIFEFTVVDVPKASDFFIFASTTSEYYAWFEVDGAGTDPKPSGKTLGTKISINSTDTPTQIAKKVSDTIQLDNFSVPESGEVFTIPAGNDNKLAAVVYL